MSTRRTSRRPHKAASMLSAALIGLSAAGTVGLSAAMPALAQAAGPLFTVPSATANGQVGEAFRYDLTQNLSNPGNADGLRAAAFALPAGLRLEGTRLVGQPTAAGSQRAIILAASNGVFGSLTLRVEVAPAAATTEAEAEEERFVFVSANMAVQSAASVLADIDAAKAAGANAVLFSDTKLNRYGVGDAPGARWLENTRALAAGVRERDMRLVLNTITLGYCNGMLPLRPELTAGYEVRDQPLVLRGDRLVPASTASVTNGGFEAVSGAVPDGWDFFDDPGELTVVDRETSFAGDASFRAEARGGESARGVTRFEVEPHHQYTLSFWIKTENLSASNVLALIWDGADRDRRLTHQLLSTPTADGRRDYFRRPRNLTRDWTEIRLAFNSLEAESVEVMLGLYGGTSGRIWWDEVRIEDTPTLNWVPRAGLPQSVVTADGASLDLGTQVSPIVDPMLGKIGYAGNFATYHDAPSVRALPAAGLEEGDRVLLSGYHAMVTLQGQVACSWNDPAIYDEMRRVHQVLADEFSPDGFLVNYDEIRTGGWEPYDLALGTGGDALATSISRAVDDARDAAPDADIYFWGDMADPAQNAVDKYYQVRGDLAGSWRGLDPAAVKIITWRGTSRIAESGREGLGFFSGRGFDQLIAGYYDDDPQRNYELWQEASNGVPRVVGSMYTTWTDDYSDLPVFGRLWWAD